MKLRKTVLLVASTALFATLTANSCMAKTATVNTDTLKLRKEASTSSKVLELLDIGEKLEILEDDEEWAKVKVNGTTGYVSKEYIKINEETTNTEKTNTDTETPKTETKETETLEKKSSEAEILDTKGSEINSPESNEEIVTTSTTPQETNINENPTIEQENLINQEVTVKIDSQVSILPLINASKISDIKKDEKITIIDEVNGWCYIQNENISGWARKTSLNIQQQEQTVPTSTEPVNTESTNTVSNNEQTTENTNEQVTSTTTNEITNTTTGENTTNSEENQTIEETPITEKTMYVNYSSVYIRKGPGTNYDVEDSLILNDDVTVIAESGDWYKVKSGKVTGYIAKRLLSNTIQSTSRGAEEREVEQETGESSTTQSAEEQNSGTATQTDSTQTVATTSSVGQEIVDFAKQYLGCKYVYGGSGPSTFDCSGFTMYVYKHFGVSLSHSATAQSKNGAYVAKSELQPGDLVFFKDYETMSGIGHCGIYIGEGNFIHASSGTGYCVKISTLLTGSYNTRYETARRIF